MTDRLLTSKEIFEIAKYGDASTRRLAQDIRRYRDFCRRLVACEEMKDLLPLMAEVRAALEGKPNAE